MKSAPLVGEPVILSRPKKWQDEAPPAETSPAIDVASWRADAGATTLAVPAAPVDTITYDEYRERFDTELGVLERQSRQQGLEQGQAEGRAQAAAEYAARIEALADVIAAARAALDRTIEGTAEIGIEIVCEAVAKILGEALVESDAVVSVVRHVMRQARERAKLVVHVSPRDWTLLQGERDRLLDGLSAGSVEIVADDRVQLGGCLLETPAGNFDGRIEVQLERLRDALLSAKAAAAPTEEAAA